MIVSYLVMRQPPRALGPEAATPPVAGATLRRLAARQITPAAYRRLYNGVGEPWLWQERRRMSDAALAGLLACPARELLVLEVGDQPAGYAELERRGGGGAEAGTGAEGGGGGAAGGASDALTVNLAYFGLFPAVIGRGLGPWLLDHALALAWCGETSAVTVNTCSFDHPRALGLYLSRGFEPVEHVVRTVLDPRIVGILPLTAAPHIPLARPVSLSAARSVPPSRSVSFSPGVVRV